MMMDDQSNNLSLLNDSKNSSNSLNRKLRSILLVDDDHNFLLIHKKILSSAGYRVLSSSTGNEGLETLRNERPDVVFLDVDLPDINGLDLCRAVKADPGIAGTRVFFLSGKKTSPEDRAAGLRVGADGYLLKPVGKDELLAQIESALRISETEEALRASEERYQTIADFTFGWEYWLAPDGNFVYVSPSCEKVTGYTADEFIQDSGLMGRITHPEDHGKLICFKVEQSEPLYNEHREYDFRIVTRTGKTTYISHCCKPVFSKDGCFLGRRGSNRDITERKKAEEKIKMINQQLERVNTEKDKLFSIIAHDLMSPMCGLVASTEMLANEPELLSEKDIRTLSTVLHKNAKNTLSLLEDLLQWARMSQGGIDFAPEASGLDELVDIVLSTAQDMAKAKEITIRKDFPQGLTVIVDPPMVKTVIRNILFNAIKFTHRGGEIVIRAHQEGRTVTVAIQDNGIGMNKQVVSTVFTLNKDKCHLGTEGEKGTGLGLVLCKQFIEQHGGEIWVDSAPGQGTAVFFTLSAV